MKQNNPRQSLLHFVLLLSNHLQIRLAIRPAITATKKALKSMQAPPLRYRIGYSNSDIIPYIDSKM